MAREPAANRRWDSSEDIASEPEHGNRGRIKFVLHGREMIEKSVTRSGKSGRVYLPLDWVGDNVKIIRLD